MFLKLFSTEWMRLTRQNSLLAHACRLCPFYLAQP